MDYVEMLEAAGWIEPGMMDDQYQAYLSAKHGDQDDTMDYEAWKAFTKSHVELTAKYDAYVAEHNLYNGYTQFDKEIRADQMMTEMSWNEWILRY